jgi:alpha-D-ribose 1-methylphosphonate 5-triphosphate diphosphatase PhnM
MDHTKVTKPKGAFSVFVGLSTKKIDCIIMDNKTEDADFGAFRRKLEELKIPLLTPSLLGLCGSHLENQMLPRPKILEEAL